MAIHALEKNGREVKKKALALIPAALGLMLGLVLGIPSAHASGGSTGMCDSGAGSSWCWRQVSGGGTDYWARDISGDPAQHYTLTYEGTVSSTGCHAGAGISGSDGVWVFTDFVLVIGAGYQEYVGEDPGTTNPPSPYDLWAWTGGGQLINCGQSAHWGSSQFLCRVGAYHQLYVRGAGGCNVATWVNIDPK